MQPSELALGVVNTDRMTPMLPRWIQSRAAEVQQDWTETERARRAELAEARVTELIELISGATSQKATNPGQARVRAGVSVAS